MPLQAFFIALLTKLAEVFAPKIWRWLSDSAKDKLAENHVEAAVDAALDKYAGVMDEQKVMAADGLTEAEKEIIRAKKAKIRADIINAQG